jgi:predicted Zn-ribbon and HTH transcriptional regulator
MENKRQALELADIFNSYGEAFFDKHELCPDQIKAYNAIRNCRTARLGGHSDQCDHCGYTRNSYNSCRNRHCPKCQFLRKAKWVDKLAANLPPVKHFHVVFTIPTCLNVIFYLNQDKAYSMLFKAAGQTLLQCAATRQNGGFQAGAVGVLHTWGQTLVYHPHIHMIVPAGGLSADEMEWIHSSKKFFLPVKILSKIFRGILCRLLEQAVTKGVLNLPEGTSCFEDLKRLCYQKNWVVYCQKPFANTSAIIEYLGNYTHRVAISNHRLKAFEEGKVTFSYKDYKNNAQQRSLTLDSCEFIRRFLQHILPCGFYKIRYFGILALCNLKSKLSQCLSLIGKATWFPVMEGLNAMEVWQTLSGRDPFRCPKCFQGRMISGLLLKSGVG